MLKAGVLAQKLCAEPSSLRLLRPSPQRPLLSGGDGGRRFLFGLGKLQPSEHSHKERRLLKFPPQHVYAVVSNVAEYKEFVPWCIDSRVLKHEPPRYMEAELSVGFQFFSERYISRVTMEPETKVSVRLLGNMAAHTIAALSFILSLSSIFLAGHRQEYSTVSLPFQ
jgi:Polyketide cyclase / dehydrase and lipid transport